MRLFTFIITTCLLAGVSFSQGDRSVRRYTYISFVQGYTNTAVTVNQEDVPTTNTSISHASGEVTSKSTKLTKLNMGPKDVVIVKHADTPNIQRGGTRLTQLNTRDRKGESTFMRGGDAGASTTRTPEGSFMRVR